MVSPVQRSTASANQSVESLGARPLATSSTAIPGATADARISAVWRARTLPLLMTLEILTPAPASTAPTRRTSSRPESVNGRSGWTSLATASPCWIRYSLIRLVQLAAIARLEARAPPERRN